jgi:homospermidine synthase
MEKLLCLGLLQINILVSFFIIEGKSWVPFEDTEGLLIPHGEVFTIRDFFHDPETGYAPSQYYVYSYNPYAQKYIESLPSGPHVTLQNTNPEWEVLHPMNYELYGYDKVGALLLFNNNRGWWAGSIMDEFDAAKLFNHKYGPTILQVTGGVFSAFEWMCQNPNAGNKWPEDLDTEYVIDKASPYLGRVWSDFVDLTKTKIKDCQKIESFLVKKYKGPINRKNGKNYL